MEEVNIMRQFVVLACLLGAAYAWAPGVNYMTRSVPYSLVPEPSPADEALIEKRGACSSNSGSPKMSSSDQRKYVNAHNNYRSKEGISTKLVWDDGLALQAEKNVNAKSGCGMQHGQMDCSGGHVGQNLAWDWSSNKQTKEMDPDKVVGMWYDEVKDYNKGSKRCNGGKVCGHYTQVIWKKSKRVGCAAKVCGNERLVACDYDPPGNYVGQTPWSN